MISVFILGLFIMSVHIVHNMQSYIIKGWWSMVTALFMDFQKKI